MDIIIASVITLTGACLIGMVGWTWVNLIGRVDRVVASVESLVSTVALLQDHVQRLDALHSAGTHPPPVSTVEGPDGRTMASQGVAPPPRQGDIKWLR